MNVIQHTKGVVNGKPRYSYTSEDGKTAITDIPEGATIIPFDESDLKTQKDNLENNEKITSDIRTLTELKAARPAIKLVQDIINTLVSKGVLESNFSEEVTFLDMAIAEIESERDKLK